MTEEEIKWRHIAGCIAQEASRAIPDLEWLERIKMDGGLRWSAAQTASRIRALRRAIDAADKGKL